MSGSGALDGAAGALPGFEPTVGNGAISEVGTVPTVGAGATLGGTWLAESANVRVATLEARSWSPPGDVYMVDVEDEREAAQDFFPVGSTVQLLRGHHAGASGVVLGVGPSKVRLQLFTGGTKEKQLFILHNSLRRSG